MAMKAIILVGGPSKGTRFRPLSLALPKPLFPIGGVPLLHHHVAACAKVHGLNEVILIGFFDPALFADFIRETSEQLGISIKYEHI
jgi:mannose-1-phosphate guanylyltransferase